MESNEIETKSVQVMFRMPSAFIERFDKIAEAFGYSRTEAIRESMRRFEQQLADDLKERPEEAARSLQMAMEGMFRSIVKMGQEIQGLQGGQPAGQPGQLPEKSKNGKDSKTT